MLLLRYDRNSLFGIYNLLLYMGLSIIDFPSTLRRWAKIHRLA
jgi:hypothetical protein